MTLNEFIKAHLNLGKFEINETDLKSLSDYVNSLEKFTNTIEYASFLDTMLALSREFDIVDRIVRISPDMKGEAMRMIIFIRTLEAVKEYRETLQEVFKTPEFNPTSSS